MPKLKFYVRPQKIGFTKRVLLVLRPWRYSTISLEEVGREAALSYGLNIESMAAIIEVINFLISNYVLNGHSVQIPYIGNMRASISAKSVENAADLSVDLIRARRVNFLASKKLREMIAATEFELIPEKVRNMVESTHTESTVVIENFVQGVKYMLAVFGSNGAEGVYEYGKTVAGWEFSNNGVATRQAGGITNAIVFADYTD